MVIIDILADKMADELEDAEDYIREALIWRDTCPDVAALFMELSKEEMRHSDRLHDAAVREIDRAKSTGKTVSPEMLARYNAKHDKRIRKAATVVDLQKMYK